MGERRGSRRLKSFLRGTVCFDKKQGTMSCLVRDLSAVGARIIFSENVTIPDVVTLHIPQKEKTLRARVQWRHGDEIGLGFTAASAASAARAAADAPDAAELTKRVAQLEADIAALRRVLKKLKGERTLELDGEVAA